MNRPTVLRKSIAIFLLFIHIYNLIGYRAIFAYLEQKATSSIVMKLDKGQYHDDELIEMKIPYKLLYTPSLPEYIRYDGDIEIQGIYYNYVKRKFANDTLYLLCIPNETNTKLASVKNNYFDNASNTSLTTPKKSKSTPVTSLKCFSSDCSIFPNSYELTRPKEMVNDHAEASEGKLPEAFVPSLYKPPRLIA